MMNYKVQTNNTFLTARMHLLFYGLIFVEKDVQRMLKMSRILYTGRNFKHIVCKKTKGKLGTLSTMMLDGLTICCLLTFAEIYYGITARMTYAFKLRKL